MKTVKLSEVTKKGWRVSPADRLNINSLENSKKVSASMEKIAEVMASNIELLDKLALKIGEITVEPMGKGSNPAPNVEVIIPPAKQEKKTFRVTPVRDEDGRLKYVDIKQL